MTAKEERKKILKLAKRQHKEALKDKSFYKIKRDNLVKKMLDTETPNWGSLKLSLVKL